MASKARKRKQGNFRLLDEPIQQPPSKILLWVLIYCLDKYRLFSNLTESD